MAIDTETRRVSTLQTASSLPGKNFMQSEPDGSDLDDANQRGFVLWHYAGISAGAAAPVVFQSSISAISSRPPLLI